ncbi:MAG TPA: DNA-processing protein DprA [Polyangiaceae bacterium]|nr:DNA-processing protein DprA [Polyangiaceae bacterium]
MQSDQPRQLQKREWPARLLDLHEPPASLYLSGALPGPPYVAVVGTRRPTDEGLAFAQVLAGELARVGVGVVSGGALGIDAAVHRGVLDAGGCTLVVAPAGWNRPFPPEHTELFREVVARGGGYLSLCSPDEVATRARFFSRNACLVALAHVVVVVEAGYRSGARNAAKHARVLGRKLFAVPAAPWVPSGRGCLAELKAGAAPLESAKDVLAYLTAQNLHVLGPQLGLRLGEEAGVPLGEGAAPQAVNVPRAANVSGAASAQSEQVRADTATSMVLEVLRAVQAGASTYDAICAATGLSLRDVQHAVFDLRVAKNIEQDPMGFLRPGRV